MSRLDGENIFQTRLNQLFAESDRRLTNSAVAKGLLAQGCRISVPYLSQLRSGVRAGPSDEIVPALAEYFSVSPGYFFTIPVPAGHARAQAPDAAILERLDDPVLRELLEAANGLSTTSLGLLATLASKLRVYDLRPAVPADSPAYLRLGEATRRMRKPTRSRADPIL